MHLPSCITYIYTSLPPPLLDFLLRTKPKSTYSKRTSIFLSTIPADRHKAKAKAKAKKPEQHKPFRVRGSGCQPGFHFGASELPRDSLLSFNLSIFSLSYSSWKPLNRSPMISPATAWAHSPTVAPWTHLYTHTIPTQPQPHTRCPTNRLPHRPPTALARAS